jgi:hypothetical protein
MDDVTVSFKRHRAAQHLAVIEQQHGLFRYRGISAGLRRGLGVARLAEQSQSKQG